MARRRRASRRVVRLTRTGGGVLAGSVIVAALGIVLGLSPLVGIGAAGLAAVLLAVVLVHEPLSIDVGRSAQPREVERGVRPRSSPSTSSPDAPPGPRRSP